MPIRIAQVPQVCPVGLALLSFMGCGSGAGPGSPAPEMPDPRVTISQFMDAVKAEDLVAMSRLWGTEDGPIVDRLDAREAEQRLRLMQIYLEHDDFTAVMDDGQVFANMEREVHYRVTIARKNCRPVVPFKLVRFGSSWLIENVNLAEAGNPGRSCGSVEEQ